MLLPTVNPFLQIDIDVSVLSKEEGKEKEDAAVGLDEYHGALSQELSIAQVFTPS